MHTFIISKERTMQLIYRSNNPQISQQIIPMDFPLILMRHSESEHNVAKQVLKIKLKSDRIKNSKQYKAIKYRTELRDDHITPHGIRQAVEASKQIDWKQVSLILVSPLRRCLETCEVMLKNAEQKNQVKVVIDPVLASRFSSAWSVGSDKEKLKQEFPKFCFQNLEDGKIPWFATNLEKKDQSGFEVAKNPLALLKETKVEESREDFQKRAIQIRQCVDRALQKSDKKRILVISHNCTLKLFTTVKFAESGKSMSQISFQNAQPIYVNRNLCFRYLEPTPKF